MLNLLGHIERNDRMKWSDKSKLLGGDEALVEEVQAGLQVQLFVRDFCAEIKRFLEYGTAS